MVVQPAEFITKQSGESQQPDLFRPLPFDSEDIVQGFDSGESNAHRVTSFDRKRGVGWQIDVKEAVAEKEVDPFWPEADHQGVDQLPFFGFEISEDPVAVPLLAESICPAQVLLDDTGKGLAFIT